MCYWVDANIFLITDVQNTNQVDYRERRSRETYERQSRCELVIFRQMANIR